MNELPRFLNSVRAGSGMDFWWMLPEFWMVAIGCVLLTVDMFRKPGRVGLVAGLSAWGFGLVLLGQIAFVIAMARGGTGHLSDGVGPMINGMYQWDGLTNFARIFFVATGTVVVLMMSRSETALVQDRGELFVIPWFAVPAMSCMVAAADFITLFVSLELLTVCFYVLVSFHRTEMRSLEAGVKYLILAALSSAFLVYGMAMLFGAAGSLDYAEIGRYLGSGAGRANPLVTLGVALVVIGICFKIAAVPFQWWVPDVYQGAPTAVTALLSVGSKAAGFFVFLRWVQGPFAPVWPGWAEIVGVLAALSIIFGNLGALSQRNLKRMLGYSSISHAGYLLVALAAGSVTGTIPLLFYLLTYGAAALLVFLVICSLTDQLGGTDVDHFRGLAVREPFSAWVMLAGMVSLAGVPPLGGFLAKWFVFAAGWKAGMSGLVFVGALGAAASIYYYLAVARSMFFEAPAKEASTLRVDGVTRSVYIVLLTVILAAGLAPLSIFGIVTAFVWSR